MQPITIVIDTREQEPFSFDPARVSSVRRALPIGDYSLDGYEEQVAVERKSLNDFVGSVINQRDRFERELLSLADYELGCVVVEASMEDVLEHRYRSGAHPNAVFGAAMSIIVDLGVPVYFASDRQIACRFVQDFLLRFHQRQGSK